MDADKMDKLQKGSPSLLSSAKNFFPTKTVVQVQKAFTRREYTRALEITEKALAAPVLDAPDVALLKLNPTLAAAAKGAMPKGLPTAIRDLHIPTARALATAEGISYDTKQNRFVVDAAPDNSCTAKEANIIFGAARLFDGLTEEDLISFLRHLASSYPLALHHPVGQKILTIAQNITDTVGFTAPFYYHARPLPKGACPYTDEEMVRAPHGLPAHARFNYTGQSHYYCADQKAGALREIKIHYPQKTVSIQVATLTIRRPARLVDLSDLAENTFLKFCRFPYDPANALKMPREYLIPSFFAACCKQAGLDGIKYKGAADYHNYVTWSDEHYQFVSQSVEND